MNLGDFFYMGGYAFYVWTAYGIAFLALVINLVNPIMQRRRLIGQIARRLQRAGRS